MAHLLNLLGLDASTILLTFVAFTMLFLVIRNHHKPVRKPPPGPGYRLPILGHLASLNPKAPYKTLNQLACKYGPVFLLQFGSFPVVILNDFESIRQAFIKQGDEFDDRPKLLIFEMGNPGKGMWRKERKKKSKMWFLYIDTQIRFHARIHTPHLATLLLEINQMMLLSVVVLTH